MKVLGHCILDYFQGCRQEFWKGGSIILTCAKIFRPRPLNGDHAQFCSFNFMVIVTMDMVRGRPPVCIILKVEMIRQGSVVARAWKLMEGKLI